TPFPVGKEKFHKPQHWGFCNNVRMLMNEDKPGIGGELCLRQKRKPQYSAFLKEMGIDAPPWVAFDKQVLSFDAYLEDEVPEKSQENYRIRRYKIYFYLEDDTIQVNEPGVRNSGLPQGTFIRRHHIPLPPPDEDQFYTVYHFNINIDIVFYGWKFKIYDCDTFTKIVLKNMGVKLNAPGQCPEDPYLKMQREKLDFVKPLRPYESFDTLKQFLNYDRKVLRFFCLWDDSTSLFGDRRELILHYFLSDDTIEIKEVLPHNSGWNAMPFFLQRGKLPKYGPPGVYQPGEITDRIVLNVYGGLVENRVDGYLLDKYKLGKVHQEFYKDSDLSIGTTINVWGRKVLLCDCDEFTKSYYKTEYGIGKFFLHRQCMEDYLYNAVTLISLPFSYGYISNTLRFFAKLITHDCADVDRLFVISYFLSDDTLSVFEPIERNSGLTGGMFLKRIRVKRPGQEVFKSELSEYIKAEELYVGARVNVNGYLFLLLNADEYTLNYMEKHSDKFPMSSIEPALQKLKKQESKSKELRNVFIAADDERRKMVDYNTFSVFLLLLLFCVLLRKPPLSQYSSKVYWKHFSEFMGLFGKHLGQAGDPRRKSCSADGGLTRIVGGIKDRQLHCVIGGWPQGAACPLLVMLGLKNPSVACHCPYNKIQTFYAASRAMSDVTLYFQCHYFFFSNPVLCPPWLSLSFSNTSSSFPPPSLCTCSSLLECPHHHPFHGKLWDLP
uniref:EF-hand domain containing 2 n=1 Tax=Equus asinus asinus TaxID=83772 RepID=A0A8C4M6K1_EQUAS